MQKFLKQWSDLNQKAVLTTQKWVGINTDLMVNLTQQQMDMVAICLATGNQQAQALTQAKHLPDLFAAQSQGLEDFHKKFFNNIRVTVEMLADVKQQLTDWLQGSLQQAVVAAGPLKAAAKA